MLGCVCFLLLIVRTCLCGNNSHKTTRTTVWITGCNLFSTKTFDIKSFKLSDSPSVRILWHEERADDADDAPEDAEDDDRDGGGPHRAKGSVGGCSEVDKSEVEDEDETAALLSLVTGSCRRPGYIRLIFGIFCGIYQC